MAQSNGTNGRTGNSGNRGGGSNGTKTPPAPPAPQVPTVLAVTLPDEDDWDVGNYAILDPDGLPEDVILVAMRAVDMHLSSTKKTVIRANAQFERIDRVNTLSFTLMRKANQKDLDNSDLANPKNQD